MYKEDNLNPNSNIHTAQRSTQSGTIWGTAGKDYLNGTTFDDVINSREGKDSLHGGAGDDVLISFSDGFDELYGDEGNDYLKGGDNGNLFHGGSGDDEAHGGQSADKINGDSGNDFLIGNAGKDKLSGGFGDDVLVGGSEADQLVGGWGADIFRFVSIDSVDVISDFNFIPEAGFEIAQGDRLELSLDAFSALTSAPGGTLNEDEFFIGAEATTESHRIIYDQANGLLSYDADGSGSTETVAFASLTGNVTLTASDFLINL